MTAHFDFFESQKADIVVLTETKLGDPPAMFPPPMEYGWYALHIPSKESGNGEQLRGSNSGGVTVLVHKDLGIVLSIDTIVYKHYAMTVTIHHSPPDVESPNDDTGHICPSTSTRRLCTR